MYNIKIKKKNYFKGPVKVEQETYEHFVTVIVEIFSKEKESDDCKDVHKDYKEEEGKRNGYFFGPY